MPAFLGDWKHAGRCRLFLRAEQNRGGADLVAIAEYRDHSRLKIDGDDNRSGWNIGLVPVPFAVFDRAGDRQDALDDKASRSARGTSSIRNTLGLSFGPEADAMALGESETTINTAAPISVTNASASNFHPLKRLRIANLVSLSSRLIAQFQINRQHALGRVPTRDWRLRKS